MELGLKADTQSSDPTSPFKSIPSPAATVWITLKVEVWLCNEPVASNSFHLEISYMVLSIYHLYITTNQNQRHHHTIFKWKQIAHIISCLQNRSSCFGIFENNKKHTKHLDNTDLLMRDKTAVFFPCCLLREGVIIALPRTHRQQHGSALQTPGESTQEKPACLVPGINGQCKTGHWILEHVFFILQKAQEGVLIGHSPSWFQTENPEQRSLLRHGSEEPHSEMAPILPPLCLFSLYLTVSLHLWVAALGFFHIVSMGLSTAYILYTSSP